METETDKKDSIVDQIEEFVDSFLGRRAATLGIEKVRLSVYLRIVQLKGDTLEILLFRDKEFIGYVQMTEVLTGLLKIFAGPVESKIRTGFRRFAEAKEYEATKLLLELSHHQDKLIYKVYYDQKPIEVNLEEFFTPKKEE